LNISSKMPLTKSHLPLYSAPHERCLGMRTAFCQMFHRPVRQIYSHDFSNRS
jgi:hypothetical protein